ncbi:MAG: PilZ domain-containing protein [Amphritea sp.]|nr:PilZ domain-containing protein [Amphritea sp.]
MDQERRQYFRINGRVALDFEVVSPSEIRRNQLPSQFTVSPFFMLLIQLQELSHDNQYQLRKIAQKDPTVAAYLENLNAKIDAVAQAVAKSDVEFKQLSSQEINISEGGMSFSSNRPVNTGDCLALKLVFEETFTGLLLYGKVLYCGEDEENYKIGIEFMDMPESSRVIVARHILSSQARELQDAKKQ